MFLLVGAPHRRRAPSIDRPFFFPKKRNNNIQGAMIEKTLPEPDISLNEKLPSALVSSPTERRRKTPKERRNLRLCLVLSATLRPRLMHAQ